MHRFQTNRNLHTESPSSCHFVSIHDEYSCTACSKIKITFPKEDLKLKPPNLKNEKLNVRGNKK